MNDLPYKCVPAAKNKYYQYTLPVFNCIYVYGFHWPFTGFINRNVDTLS